MALGEGDTAINMACVSGKRLGSKENCEEISR
jgi:hypothetical protein